ncbi:MAG: 1-deoxy-D-xylulose-5-phosphate synthase [Clostridiales bacterium]|nr:1-deoxy-D-xylulose-5-phosphate synthase [Clostridiales bacterium]
MEYLKNIKSPEDVKKLDTSQLNDLSAEIRETLIDTVSRTGGHMSSNLGVVELTVAIHKMFDCPKDTIIFDVGHQAYTHKLLTGRYEKFSLLRCADGISGFPNPSESECDPFYSGHSGTSVSAAIGVAAANSILGNNGYVVAVVGDGSMTNGLIYEALNNANVSGKRLIVILNDNKMSISQNVGSLARYLAVIRSKSKYLRTKTRVEKVLNHIPLVGKSISKCVYRMKTSLKQRLYKSNLFEDMGFAYMGPIDGHNIELLCDALETAKLVTKPVLLHVNTVKGKGYDFAEKSPTMFHGISKFDIDTGEPLPSSATFSKEFGDAMCSFASNDRKICAITAAMSVGTGLQNFEKNYPKRFFDVGIAEEHAVVFAQGLSKQGLRPVFAVYSTFLQRCFDQLIHDGALQKRSLVIAADRAGFVGEDGETHQGIFDVAMMNGIPDITVYSPSTYEELNKFLYKSIYESKNVSVVRYPRGSEGQIPEDFKPSFASYDVYGDKDSDIALVTYGRIFSNACIARDMLGKDGIKIKIIKLNRIKPVDINAVNEALSCEKVFFFEEGIRSSGVGEKFASLLLENGYKGEYDLTAVNDCFVPQASVEKQLETYGLDCDGMYRKILGVEKIG